MNLLEKNINNDLSSASPLRRSSTGGTQTLPILKLSSVIINIGQIDLQSLDNKYDFDIALDDSGTSRMISDIKNNHPHSAVILMSAINDCDAIKSAYENGVDAILISPSDHDKNRLQELYDCAKSLDLSVIIEIKNVLDITKARSLRPEILFIDHHNDENPDNLKAIILRELVDWKCRVICGADDCSFGLKLAEDEGFDIINIKYDSRLDLDMLQAFQDKPKNNLRRRFWTKLMARKRYTRPFVKISGLIRSQDVNLAVNQSADILGFKLLEHNKNEIFELIDSLPNMENLKVLTINGEKAADMRFAVGLINNHKIDAVEVMGEVSDDECIKLFGSQFYKLAMARSLKDIDDIQQSACARIMLEPSEVSENENVYRFIDTVSKNLWLSGDVSVDNIKRKVKMFRPELIDISDNLNTADGIKDPALVRKFFKDVLYAK